MPQKYSTGNSGSWWVLPKMTVLKREMHRPQIKHIDHGHRVLPPLRTTSLFLHINATAPRTAAPRTPIPWAIKLFAEPVLEAPAALAPLADVEAVDAVADAPAVVLDDSAAVPLLDPESGHVGAGRLSTPASRQRLLAN